MNRRSLFGSLFDSNGFGLEIGPSYNPTLRKSEGFNIEIADFQDAAALRRWHPDHDIEEVDYVTDGRPLTEVIDRRGAYDFIIASHVVSHIPDLIRFLTDCQELLKSDGVLVMAVPDKRRCFTLYRPISTTGDVLQARLEGRHRHPPGRHFDQHAFTAARDGHVVWPLDYPVPPEPVASLAVAQTKFNQAAASTTYIDTHSWSFLPSSFRLIMRDLWDLGETRLREHRFIETSGPEFFISLGQFGPGCPLNRSFLLRRILAEMAAVQEVRDAVISAQKGANEVSEPNAAPPNGAPLVEGDGSLLIRSLTGHYQPLRWHPDGPQSRAGAEAEVPVGWQPAFICDDLLPVRLLLLDGPAGEQRVWFVDKSGMLLGTHVDELMPEHRQALGFALQNLSHDRTTSGLLATARLDRISRKIRLQLDSLLPNATYDRGLELGQAMAASPMAKMTELVRIDAASPRQIPAQLSAGWSIGEVNGGPAIVATGRRSVISFDAVPQAGSYYVGIAYDRLRASGRVTVRVNGRLLGISPLRKVWLHEWPHIGYWIAPQLVRSGSIEITLEHEIAASGDPPALRSVKLLAGERRTSGDAETLPADKLMLKFQSLGDNCQFGFVQRHFGAEPMGLLRFAGIPNLTGAIEAGLEGLGTKGTVRHSLATDKEYMIDETVYGIFYHTFRYADQIAAEQVIAENEIKLHFLRRKFIEDMEDAETIWLRRCSYSNDISEIFALQMAMRAYGPNKLLWVVPAGPDREAGDVEWIAPGLLRGYLGRDASFDPSNFNPAHWELMCRKAYAAFQSA